MAKRVKEVEVKATMSSVNIFCPVLGKEVTTTDYSFSASESECELCGSHGRISVYITKCECGKSHDIEISSW